MEGGDVSVQKESVWTFHLIPKKQSKIVEIDRRERERKNN
jgi:hypothetical protein